MHREAAPPTARNLTVPTTSFVQQRLKSLDAYRGLIMIALAFNGFGLAAVARNQLATEAHAQSKFWQGVAYQFNHVEWVGGGFWDMIQPSFMFMVGVSLPYSFAARRKQGASWFRMLCQAAIRSLVLIGLGIFLISNGRDATNWSLMNVLTQIGLGYTFLFLLWERHIVWQALAAVALLVGTWALYMFHPQAGVSLETGAPQVGVTQEWAYEHLYYVPPAWHKNANVGHSVDLVVLNKFPKTPPKEPAAGNQDNPPADKPFAFNAGGYQTINFIPSLATMLFGLMAGQLLRSERSAGKKWLILLAAGLVAIGTGVALHYGGVCPLVKRIWTPSWAIYSTGWCLLMLSALYGVIDVLGWSFWTFPLTVVGMNSIAMYVMGQMMTGWTAQTLKTHLGAKIFETCATTCALDGNIYEPLFRCTLVGMCFWLACVWMYRQKIFVRI